MGHVARGVSQAIALLDLLHDFREEVAGGRRAKKALKAACSHEVGVSRAVVAVQIWRHGKDVTGRATILL